MKLRIVEGKIRLRLSQREVEEVAMSNEVVQELKVGGGVFKYAFRSNENIETIQVSLGVNTFAIEAPKKMALEWAINDVVGMYHVNSDANNPLEISIEKDFQCLHKRPGEDESDSFPNPKMDESF